MLGGLMGGGNSGGGSGGQNAFVGMAMGQASKLFDQQQSQGGTVPGANKQDVVNKAAEMAMKMYVKNQMSSGGGGVSGLMGMAGNFLK